MSTQINQVLESARRGELVVVCGSGLSMGLTNGAMPALSWRGLIKNGFEYAVTKGKIAAKQADSWQMQRESADIDELLSAAEFLGRKLDSPNGHLYARWLKSVFEGVQPSNKLLEKAVNQICLAKIPIATLNYDHLLESCTGMTAINHGDTPKIAEWVRSNGNSSVGVYHLHGSWDVPASCVLGIRDYEATLKDDVRELFQRSLSAFSRLLFI
jgi:hypothetical protein